MAHVGDSAHTPHGLGQITEILNERGRLSYRVAGTGFNVWVDETKLHVAGQHRLDDPTPGEPVTNPYTGDDSGGFRGNPLGHGHWDPENHLSQDDPRQPGHHYQGGLESTIDRGEGTVNENNHTTLPYNWEPQNHVDLFRHEQTIQPGEFTIDADERLHPSDSVSGNSRTDVKGPQPSSGLFAAPGRDNVFADERTSSYRPAGLNDRYAHFELEATDNDSNAAQFRRDPLGFLRTCGYLWTDGDDALERFAAETNLLDADPIYREAAWSDVRAKAMRLRHEGRVQINEHGAGRIYATVEGDNGVYDTMIVKGGSYGGMGGGQSVTDWTCSCPWGRWAFKRQMTYVGRLCSHGYAAYLEMQAKDIGPEHFQKKTAGVDDYKAWLTDNNQVPEPASIASYLNTTALNLDHDDVQGLYDYVEKNPEEVPERDFTAPYTNDPEVAYKKADLLRSAPQSLTPDLRNVKPPGEEVWTDVEKDERETTGPDDIVHFSSLDTLRRLHGEVTGTGAGGPVLPTSSGMDGTGMTPGTGAAPPVEPQPGGMYAKIAASLHYAEEPPPNWATGDPGLTGGSSPGEGINWGGVGQGIKNFFHGPAFQTAPGVQKARGQDTSSPAPEVQPAAVAAPTDNGPASQIKGTDLPGAGVHPGVTTPMTAPVKPPAAPGVPGIGGGGGTGGTPGAPGGGAGGTPWKATPGLDATGTNSINDDQYKIQSGDTLNAIMERAYGKDNAAGKMDEVVKANGIKNPDMIYAGDSLKLPGASTTDSLTGKPTEPAVPGGVQPQAGVPQNEPGGGGDAGANRAADNPGSAEHIPGGPAPAPPPAAPPAAPGVGTAGQPLSPEQLTNPGLTNHASKVTSRRRYAETSDSGLLDKLRDMSSTPAADDLGHMDSRNDELRDVVDELNDRGYDASFMVAMLHDADRNQKDPTDASPSMLGLSGPDWADVGAEGSGPAPKDWISTSEDYVEENERPHHEQDWFDNPDGDIIKFNDGRSKPQQGPGAKSSAFDHTAYLHQAGAGDEEQAEGRGYFNPDNPDEQDWEQGGGGPFLDELGQQAQNVGGGGGLPGLGGGAAEEGGAAAGEGAELAELAPLLLARRAGRGPVSAPRIDPGARQPDHYQQRHAAAPPEDFGFDGGADDSAYLAVPDGGGDIVAAFQRSAGAAAVMTESRGGNDDDIARHAQAFLRTAGRKYTPEQQRELEGEFHPQGARNLPTDEDLEGTHYLLGL